MVLEQTAEVAAGDEDDYLVESRDTKDYREKRRRVDCSALDMYAKATEAKGKLQKDEVPMDNYGLRNALSK